MTTEEQWRPIPGYEGYYEASDQGRLRSLTRKDGSGRRRNGQVLKLALSPGGYLTAYLCRDRQRKTERLHRLMLMAFVGPPRAGEVGRHLNDDPMDNRLANLAWGSRSDNNYDAVRNGRNHQSNKTHCQKGHPLTGVNVGTRVRVMTHGEVSTHRYCRACSGQRKAAKICPTCGFTVSRYSLNRHMRETHELARIHGAVA